MAQAGDVLENPVLGDTITILKAPEDTNGEFLQAEIKLEPQALGPPLHAHPRLEDRFKGLEGTVNVVVNGREHRLGPGREVVAPPGAPHRFSNPNTEPVRFLAEFRPASEGMITFLETVYGLARDGKVNKKGLPNPLQAAVLFNAFPEDIVLASPPIPVQRLVFGLLAPIGRLVGYRARYPRYSDPAQTAGPGRVRTVGESDVTL